MNMVKNKELAKLEHDIAEQELYIDKCKDMLTNAKKDLKELVENYKGMKLDAGQTDLDIEPESDEKD